MPNKNIALIVNRHFTGRDYDRFGVGELSKYFNVWVFDTSFQGKNAQRNTNKKADGNNASKTVYKQHVIINEIGEIEHFLQAMTLTYYIDLLVGATFTNLAIRRVLNKNNIKRVKLVLGELPEYGKSQTGMAKLKSAIKRGGFLNKLTTYVCANYMIKYLEPKIDLAVFSGEICLKRYPDLARDVIWAHSIDYQIYLDSLQWTDGSNGRNSKAYALFLDQNAPAHPDYAYHGNIPPVTKDCYYQAINDFFDDFENTTGIEVIIAGHPRSSQELEVNWPGKQFVLRQTPQLVKEAKLVFAHYSTAISFPVLWRKPIIQLTTNEYMNSYRKDRFKAFASRLNMPTLNVDRYDSSQMAECNKFELEKPQQDMYEKYELDYLKSRYTEPKNMWMIVAENLKHKMEDMLK